MFTIITSEEELFCFQVEVKFMDSQKIAKKRQGEIQIVSQMIKLYCNKKHKRNDGCLCEECKKLLDYACSRIDMCRFLETKTFCSNCRTHCYHPKMREKIKEVMRYSGPRMIFYHPAACIRHGITGLIENMRR